MARRATKSAQTIPLSVLPVDGLDYSASSNIIGQNSLRRAQNTVYDAASKRLRSRCGLSCVTSNAGSLSNAGTALYAHYNGTTTYLMAACANNKLYQMSKAVLEGGTPTWTEVGALTSSKPQMITFNTKLVLADNHTALRVWEAGGSYTTLSGSPANCTSIIQGRNRLIANSHGAGGLDGVYFCGPEDETDWTSNAVTVRAGYKDGMRVNGLALWGNDVIVSKRGVDGGASKLFRINIESSTPSEWFAEDLVQNYSAQGAHGIKSAWNDVLFFDDTGLYNLQGVQEYGDLKMFNTGDKINSLLKSNNTLTIEEIVYVPKLGAVAILLDGSDGFYLMFPHTDANGNATYKFTYWYVRDVVINSIATLGDNTYFLTNDGRLLRLDESAYSDEISDDTYQNYETIVRTKRFDFSGYDGRVRRVVLKYAPLDSGVGVVSAISPDETTATTLKSFSVGAGGELIGGTVETTELIGGSASTTELIGSDSVAPTSAKSRQRFRDSGVSFQVVFSSGARAEIVGIDAEISAPLGR